MQSFLNKTENLKTLAAFGLPVLLGSWERCPPSEWCNLSVMPWILSTKLLRACAWLSPPAKPPPTPTPPPPAPPEPLHCGISSAMLLMFGMEPNYGGWEAQDVLVGQPKEMFRNYSHAHKGHGVWGVGLVWRKKKWRSRGRRMVGWDKDEILPLVWDVTGAQAAVLLMAAIWLSARPCSWAWVTFGLRKDTNKCLARSSGASQSRKASRKRRKPSKSMSCQRKQKELKKRSSIVIYIQLLFCQFLISHHRGHGSVRLRLQTGGYPLYRGVVL